VKDKSIGAFWKRESKGGKTYLTGKVDGIGDVVVFKCERKSSEKSPDYQMFKSEKRQAPAAETTPPAYVTGDEDIPF